MHPMARRNFRNFHKFCGGVYARVARQRGDAPNAPISPEEMSTHRNAVDSTLANCHDFGPQGYKVCQVDW
jgi:hypothetical protein